MNRLQEIIDASYIHSLPDRLTVITRMDRLEPNEIILEMGQDTWNKAAGVLGNKFIENSIYDIQLADTTVIEVTPPELNQNGDVIPGWFVTLSGIVIAPPKNIISRNIKYSETIPGLIEEQIDVYIINKGFNHKLYNKIKDAADTISEHNRKGVADNIPTSEFIPNFGPIYNPNGDTN